MFTVAQFTPHRDPHANSTKEGEVFMHVGSIYAGSFLRVYDGHLLCPGGLSGRGLL